MANMMKKIIASILFIGFIGCNSHQTRDNSGREMTVQEITAILLQIDEFIKSRDERSLGKSLSQFKVGDIVPQNYQQLFSKYNKIENGKRVSYIFLSYRQFQREFSAWLSINSESHKIEQSWSEILEFKK
jgi:hypothetical protein